MKRRGTSVRIAALGALCASSLFVTAAASRIAAAPHRVAAAATVPAGWTAQSVGTAVSFAYPSDFVPAGDGAPNMTLVGGALLNRNRTVYKLLLGVAVDTAPGVTPESEAQRLKAAYANDTLLLDSRTAYGRELSFAMPGHMTYQIYIAPIAGGVREILINNETSNPAYAPIIQQFLGTVHDTGQGGA